MTKKVTLFSGRVATVDPTEVSADRYRFLRLAEAEPSLGAPTVDGAFIYSTQTGQRTWTTQLTTDANGNLQTAGVTITDNRIESRNPTEPLEISGGISGEVIVDSNLVVNGTISFEGGIEELNLSSGQVISIGGVEVLSETSLGTTVLDSSLQSVGTITTGVWEATPVGTEYGGTGLSDVPVNSVLVGQGVSPMKAIVGQPYQVLQVDASGQPIFTSLDYGNY